MITRDEVLAWFVYSPTEGGLIRKASAPIKLTTYQLANGYQFRNVRGKTIYEHRLVWLFFNEELPQVIDHIDGNKSNNRIENLRAATHTQNKHNVPKRSHNTTGAKGVVFHPLCPIKPYQAKIVKHGRTHSLGYYATVEEAAAAYEIGAKRIAGEFAKSDFNNERKTK